MQDEEHEVLLGLGANLGDPVAQLARAVAALCDEVRVDAVSSVYRTEPVGFANQPDFYNIVVRGHTRLDALGLLQRAREIEAALGRHRPFPNAPRTIDVDLLAYGDRVMRTAEAHPPPSAPAPARLRAPPAGGDRSGVDASRPAEDGAGVAFLRCRTGARPAGGRAPRAGGPACPRAPARLSSPPGTERVPFRDAACSAPTTSPSA